MGWQPGQDDDKGADPGPARDRRGTGATDPDQFTTAHPRDPHLAGFAKDGEWDTCSPSAALAAVLESAAGPEWRCPGAARDEMLGMLRQAQALESRAAAVKLGILRALVRDDGQPLPGGGYHGDLPEGWTRSLTHEVALALSMPAVSADKLMWAAWDLQARLPGIGDLLARGDLTYAKAKVIYETFLLLSDENAARAEGMILPELPGKTYGQVKRLAEQAAITVDPDAAARRREHAERDNARVEMFREDSGAVALSGRDLPTDQALAANAHVCARAQQYKDSGAFPVGTGMDQFRAAAFLDLLNSKPAEERTASGQLVTVTRAADTEPETTQNAGTGHRESDGGRRDDSRPGDRPSDDRPDSNELFRTGPDGYGSDGDDPAEVQPNDIPYDSRNDNVPGNGGSTDEGSDDGGPGSSGPTHGGPGDSGPGDSGPGTQDPSGGSGPGGTPPGSPAFPSDGGSASVTPPRLVDLALPLATLLGLAERPGESHGLGPLDPALCRKLAVAAAGSPWSRLCVTVTDPGGIAIGHGCAKPPRNAKNGTSSQGERLAEPRLAEPRRGARSALALPAQVNLTITAACLAELTATEPPGTTGPRGEPPWSFARADDPGPPGGLGTWVLTLPDGRQLSVELAPVPTFDCDHRHESRAYQPNGRLRHLVQVRDYTCTFPTCNRHAKDSDFEHATPYHRGGRTCACNAGARSRACHQVKQTQGWQVRQPLPGWHQWTTPSGRTYAQAPKRYPT